MEIADGHFEWKFYIFLDLVLINKEQMRKMNV
jgi:hypothetical protein